MGDSSEISTLYTCARAKIDGGIAVPLGQEPNNYQIMMAQVFVSNCEDRCFDENRRAGIRNGDCSCVAGCGMNELANTNPTT